MKNPGFQSKSGWLVGAALFAFIGAGLAQPTDKPANKPAPRTKPQVIYHLPASSEYAATLHSQAKGQNNAPPAEGPSASPQISHENANAGATPGRPETATSPLQERQLKRSKPPSDRSARPQSAKTKGPGNSRPNKSHKK